MATNSLYKFLRRYDQYTHKPGLNYAKRGGHETVTGIVVSILKRAFLIFYLVHLAIVCIDKRDPAITNTTVYRTFEESLQATDIGFEVAFDIMYNVNDTVGVEIKPAAEVGIDETYFVARVFQLVDTATSYSIGGEIPYYPCKDFENITGRVPFKNTPRAQVSDKLKGSYCVDSQNVTLKGDLFKGEGMTIVIEQCSYNPNGPVCQYQSTIDAVTEKLLLMTYGQQNFLDIDNYTHPIQSEIQLLNFNFFKLGITQTSIINVEYTDVDLFDNQLRIFDNIPERHLEISSCDLHSFTSANQLTAEGVPLYVQNAFFLQQEGKTIKRKTYTALNLLANYGGMNGALNLLITPLIASIIARAFDYDLITQHMKVKKRTTWNALMPQRPLSQRDATSVIQLAGIDQIDSGGKNYFCFVCCPTWCSSNQAKRTGIQKLVRRGKAQYAYSLDVINLIRLQNRVKIIENLFFSKGQLAMAGLHRMRYLKTVSSDSEPDAQQCPDSEGNCAEAVRITSENLIGYECKTELDKKIWESAVLPPIDRNKDGANIPPSPEVFSDFGSIQDTGVEMLDAKLNQNSTLNKSLSGIGSGTKQKNTSNTRNNTNRTKVVPQKGQQRFK